MRKERGNVFAKAQVCSHISGTNRYAPKAENKLNIDWKHVFYHAFGCVAIKMIRHIKHHSTFIRSATTEAPRVTTRCVLRARVGHLSCEATPACSHVTSHVPKSFPNSRANLHQIRVMPQKFKKYQHGVSHLQPVETLAVGTKPT